MASGKGTGTITPVKDKATGKPRRNVWEVQLSAGRNEYGKRKRITRTVHGTKADAQKVLRQLQSDLEKGVDPDKGKITFEQFANTWHESRGVSANLAATSYKAESSAISILCGQFGSLKLIDITPAVIEQGYNSIRKENLEKRGKYSESTMYKHHQVMRKIMQKAVDYDMIYRNPCDRVETPKCADSNRKSLSRHDGARLLCCISQREASELETFRAKEARRRDGKEPASVCGLSNLGNLEAVRIGLATGMRRGEIMALCWGCISQTSYGALIQVRYTRDVYGNVKAPKTKAGLRDIAIDQETASSLFTWKAVQESVLQVLGIEQTARTPVCCSNTGGYMDSHNFERWWRQFRKDNGFEGLRFHELRHTQATQLLANGVDLKTVQTRMGHANASITLNWYAHACPENDIAAAAIVGQVFSPKKGGNSDEWQDIWQDLEKEMKTGQTA